MSLQMWDVAWAALDPAQGREQAGRRPALVFCNDRIAARIGLVTVLPMTTLKPGRRIYPTEVLVPSGLAGLAQDSLVLCHQIRTVAADRLSGAVGSLHDRALQAAVEGALRLWLGGPLFR